ncbi:hypothetical protein D3C83_264460 [compost metagenome]
MGLAKRFRPVGGVDRVAKTAAAVEKRPDDLAIHFIAGQLMPERAHGPAVTRVDE